MFKVILKTLIFVSLLTCSFAAFCQTAYTVDQIPDPKQNGGGYVSNPDGILTSNEVENINAKIASIETESNAQIAVVIVNDYLNLRP